MQSKAAPSKVLTKWLADRTFQWARRAEASQVDKVVGACMFSYNAMLGIMSESQHVLTKQEADDFFQHTIQHLKCYVWLHSHGMTAPLHAPGRKSWLLLPKLHHLWHLAHDTRQNRLNPRMMTLLSAESFVGTIGRISRKCHRSTVSKRTLERYQIHMAFQLGKLKGD